MFYVDPLHGLHSISRKSYNQKDEKPTMCLDFLKFINLDNFGNDSKNFAAILINGHSDSRICETMEKKILQGLKSKNFSKSLIPEDIERYIELILSNSEQTFIDNMSELAKKRTYINKRMLGAEDQTPKQMQELTDLEDQLNSGVTIAIVAVIQGNLYVSNIGDNQIILVSKDNDSGDDCDQKFVLLTEDQSFNNEKEIQRIKEDCCLDADALRWLSTLSIERCHSRCIGDYDLKCNYNGFTCLSNAKCSPLISTPQVTQCVPLEENFTHILLISSGLYYLVRDLIYDRDKVAGEITRKLFELKSTSAGYLSLDNLCKSVLDSFVADHRQCYDQYQSLTTDDEAFSEYSHYDDLSLFAIELRVSQTDVKIVLETDNGFSLVESPRSNVSVGLDSLDGKDSTNNMKDQFSSLKLSSNPFINPLSAYVDFAAWNDAINKLSAVDLAYIDSIVDTNESYEETIREESEIQPVSRVQTREDSDVIVCSPNNHSNIIRGFNQ